MEDEAPIGDDLSSFTLQTNLRTHQKPQNSIVTTLFTKGGFSPHSVIYGMPFHLNLLDSGSDKCYMSMVKINMPRLHPCLIPPMVS